LRRANGRLPSLTKWQCKKSTDMLEVQRHGCTSTVTGTTLAWNTTCAIWRQRELQNTRWDTQICVYTYSASQR
jgi:hypothetical protein